MRREHIPIGIFIAGTAVGVTLLAPLAWLVLLVEGLLVPVVVVAAAGWGAWPTVWLGFRTQQATRQLCIAVALGLGLLSVLALALGTAGLLNRPVAWVVLIVGGVLGVARLQFEQRRSRPRATDGRSAADRVVQASLLLMLAIPLVVALFGACLPPGMLWQEEARGYDALEYHLQAPREYYDAGRITFLSHNVYASFPQQMEMLYLLLMHLAGDVYAAAIPAQLLHAACGVLAVVALACWTAPGRPRWLVALLAGSTPWLAQLGCLAYVENGMLFFAAVAAGLLVEHCDDKPAGPWRAFFTAGLCAGLAGGCKYTALVMVAVALALAVLVTMRASLRVRAGRVAVFGAGVLLAFGPWSIRNAAFTGNPVYPFAYEWFGGIAWSDEQDRQWSAGHAVQPEHDSLAGRLALAGRELFGTLGRRAQTTGARATCTDYKMSPSRFGQVLFLLAAVGLIRGKSRRAALLAIWAGLIVVAWITLTFIPGRFAVPLIVPLAMLGGECFTGDRPSTAHSRRPWLEWLVLPIALAGALVNGIWLAGQLRAHNDYWKANANVPLSALVGQTTIFVEGHLLTRELSTDAYAWLVGEAAVFYIDRRIHYTVPFSRDPWLEFAAAADPHECLGWLQARGVSHVVFSWPEIIRLRRTYGFSELVTREWVTQLERAGLRLLKTEKSRFGGAAVEIYEAPDAFYLGCD